MSSEQTAERGPVGHEQANGRARRAGAVVPPGIELAVFLDGAFIGAALALPKRLTGGGVELCVCLFDPDDVDRILTMVGGKALAGMAVRSSRHVAWGEGYVTEVSSSVCRPGALAAAPSGAREPRAVWRGSCDWIGELQAAPLYGPWREAER